MLYVNQSFIYMGVKKKIHVMWLQPFFNFPVFVILFWKWLDVETYNSF